MISAQTDSDCETIVKSGNFVISSLFSFFSFLIFCRMSKGTSGIISSDFFSNSSRMD